MKYCLGFVLLLITISGFAGRYDVHYSKEELKKRLTPMQYNVTQNGATEPAFHNEYWDNHAEGIYVDIVSGEPLFSSLDKYDSGTGWPSFSKALDENNIVIVKHSGFIYGTTHEARSKKANSHLGDLFFNQKSSSTGERYCIDSAALRFIPVDQLKQQGYEQYLKLFKK